MTAHPVDDYDPTDSVEIQATLPGRFHEQFLAEYMPRWQAPTAPTSTGSFTAYCSYGG